MPGGDGSWDTRVLPPSCLCRGGEGKGSGATAPAARRARRRGKAKSPLRRALWGASSRAGGTRTCPERNDSHDTPCDTAVNPKKALRLLSADAPVTRIRAAPRSEQTERMFLMLQTWRFSTALHMPGFRVVIECRCNNLRGAGYKQVFDACAGIEFRRKTKSVSVSRASEEEKRRSPQHANCQHHIPQPREISPQAGCARKTPLVAPARRRAAARAPKRRARRPRVRTPPTRPRRASGRPRRVTPAACSATTPSARS